MTESDGSHPKLSGVDLTPELIRGLGAAAGLEFSTDRAAELVVQAKPYFSAISALATLDVRDAEPAGEFRLDDKGVTR